MKVLVTGARGLLGHELCCQLVAQQHQVYALDNGFRGGTWPNSVECIEMDLTQGDLSQLPNDIDTVYHFAAINGTDYFYTIPNQLMTNNLLSDINLFRWASNIKGLSRLIYASSSEVVSGHEAQEVNETADVKINNIYNARWSYRLAKICAENYLTNSELPYVIMRYFNVYGRHSFSGHFVYDIIKKIQRQQFEIIGADETRCYCHVQDAIKATIMVSDRGGEIINIGSNQEISSRSAAIIVATAMGCNHIQWKEIPGRVGSANRRRPDITKLMNYYPEFSPRDFATGIRDVVTAFR